MSLTLEVSVNSFDMKKIKNTIDNLYLEKQKIEKGDKAKKNKGKGKAKLRMEGDNVSKSLLKIIRKACNFLLCILAIKPIVRIRGRLRLWWLHVAAAARLS